MIDHPDGIKRDVAETKFLIHDLRVESFINEVIHFHVTVNTDLEIYNVEQAQSFHSEDLQELKAKAVDQRKTLQKYSNAVKSFSPDEAILAAGKDYVKKVYDICELILDPRWGRADKVLSFLPRDSRSVRSKPHYMNCIRWICGVYYRIHYFMEEKNNKNLDEEFDIAEELQDFVRNVVYGYVTEKSAARVEIRLDTLDSAILQGNRYRFRRMFFNLVMNAVDAMSHKKLGVLTISDELDGDHVVLRARDNGSGMTEEKIRQLLTDKKSLDGELHSLGFVFVRQTIAEFAGTLSIDSQVDKGTEVAISLPHRVGGKATPRKPVECEKLDLLRKFDNVRGQGRMEYAKKTAKPLDDKHSTCGEVIYADYMVSDAQFPGSIFAIGIDGDNKIDFFTHRPYDRYWNITHEDLSPMFFEATVRGRLEEEEDKTTALILKAPQNVREYFEFRGVADADRNPEKYVELVHDEFIRIARTLIGTGMSPDIGVRLTDLGKFFPQQEELAKLDPLPLEILAKQHLSAEKKP
ncbi:MAG: ATP-binding protein [Candidatus Krumholzibacteria bacterium]|nr:ATP-binding protein [Candidatus Krumholzibacteria bacterium]